MNLEVDKYTVVLALMAVLGAIGGVVARYANLGEVWRPLVILSAVSIMWMIFHSSPHFRDY